MKKQSIPHCAAIIATGGVLLAAGIVTRTSGFAQDAPPLPRPGAPAEPATLSAPPEPTVIDPLAPPVPHDPKAFPVLPSADIAPPPAPPAPPAPPPQKASGSEPFHKVQTLRLVAPGGLPNATPAAFLEIDGSRVSAAAASADAQLTRGRATQSFHLANAAAQAGRAAVVAETMLHEESLGSPQDAARQYEAMLMEFDNQRANAAQAVFRLGEIYRKIGRPEEARIQFARILREFVDFPDLAALSQQQLSQSLPRQQAGLRANPNEDAVATRVVEDIALSRDAAIRASDEERALLHEEIQLLEREVAATQVRVDSGSANSSSILPLQREILQLKRQLLHRPSISAPEPQAGTMTIDPAFGFTPGAPTALPTPSATSVPTADPPALQTR